MTFLLGSRVVSVLDSGAEGQQRRSTAGTALSSKPAARTPVLRSSDGMDRQTDGHCTVS